MTPQFQSTPPRGGDVEALKLVREYVEFQSTPPRGGDLHKPDGENDLDGVSIHAPARGRP